MSTSEEDEKSKKAASTKQAKPADDSSSKAKAGMGILPPGADGDFLQLQALPLPPPLSNFINREQQQKNFQQLGTQFSQHLQQNPSSNCVGSMQKGPGGMQALSLAGPGKYLALA